MAFGGEHGVRIGLSAVVMALRDRRLVVLTTQEPGSETAALPFGPFDPVKDRTFELSLRAFVTAQTGFRLGFVEQLYTFGDAGRESPQPTPGPMRQREVSVGYLALTRDAASAPAPDAAWTPILDIFPWEDRRGPASDDLAQALRDWCAGDPKRCVRAETLFALAPGHRWNEERVLERYELLFEAGLVAEAGAPTTGAPAWPWPRTTAASSPPASAACAASSNTVRSCSNSPPKPSPCPNSRRAPRRSPD